MTDYPGPFSKRLIEDALPISAINTVAQREKIGHAATHPRKLHLWWARRPLAAARAAVYATLVPADGRGRTPAEEADFFDALCRWGGPESAIRRAREEVLRANDSVPPKVVDLFAGGGAIPLEAARLGCEATAIELNPVAHLIERVMLEFPQRYPGLAADVRRWGKAWVDNAWGQLADIYPSVGPGGGQMMLGEDADQGRRPLAYLWTRTVRCPNPALAEHRVDLVRQTWLARKTGLAVALRPIVDRAALTVRYEVVEATSAADLGFDPAAGSNRGETSCRVCGATVTAGYVKVEGKAGRLGVAPLAAVVLKPSRRGRDYLSVGEYNLPDDDECGRRLEKLPVDPPEEAITPETDSGIRVHLYGLSRFRDLFTPRQLLTLCTLSAGIHATYESMIAEGVDAPRATAVVTSLALTLSRLSDRSCTLAAWDPVNQTAGHAFARQALPMVWDFAEVMPWAGAAGDIRDHVETTARLLESLAVGASPVTCVRGSATDLPLGDETQDAVITDPPYYDNIFYSDIADFFYVWLKCSIGFLYPDDLSGQLTPKRNEAVAAPYRHNGSRPGARTFYEETMARAFAEAHRVLKPGAPLVCIYAHKTTLGWAALVEALRSAGFMVTEAWPLDTEMPERSRGQNSAALASSIFLVARKRDKKNRIANQSDVMAELDGIIAERLERLQQLGVTGSDLVIATVGAGLRALTRYERVEQDNGELLPAERFLAVVQGQVLDAIFGAIASAEPVTRYYLAAQYSYGYVGVPFDEANNLARITGVDLDGPHGITRGGNPLVLKRGTTVALRDFEDRGNDPQLGLPAEGSGRPSLVDVAHGVLWRAEHRSTEIRAYLHAARPDSQLLRQVVQALAGKALRSGIGDAKPREAAAAERLLVSWRRLVEESLFSS